MLSTQVFKNATRRVLWIGHEFFWNQVLPFVAGRATELGTRAVQARLPQTPSPLLIGTSLYRETADGAVLAGLVPPKAWAKYAIPKGLPKDGKVLGIENEPHLVDDFSGEIGEGYGEGVKTLLLSDSVIVKVAGKTTVQKVNYHVHKTTRSLGREHYDLVVTGIKPGTKQWELHVPRGEYKGRYAFIKAGAGTIVTRMKDQGVVKPKPDYTLRKEEVLLSVDPQKQIVERKIDGSLGNAHVQGQRVAFRSHRDGGETYYDRLPYVEFIGNSSPFVLSRVVYPGPDLSGTIFQGELAHPDGAARVSGILNSLPENSRAIQDRRGPVRYFVWDVLRYKGRDTSSLPYQERRELYRRLVDEIRITNQYWDSVEAMSVGEHPRQFYDRVTRDPLPWGEGVVVKLRDATTQKWDKIKMVGFGYFKLVEVLPGEGKYAGSVGRLVVENPANGARGEVGSLSVPNEYRDWIWQHRGDLLGEVVKVRSQEVTSRGVPRAGVFYGFHEGEVDLLMAAEAAAGSTDPKVVKPMVYRMKSAAGWKRK